MPRRENRANFYRETYQPHTRKESSHDLLCSIYLITWFQKANRESRILNDTVKAAKTWLIFMHFNFPFKVYIFMLTSTFLFFFRVRYIEPIINLISRRKSQNMLCKYLSRSFFRVNIERNCFPILKPPHQHNVWKFLRGLAPMFPMFMEKHKKNERKTFCIYFNT